MLFFGVLERLSRYSFKILRYTNELAGTETLHLLLHMLIPDSHQHVLLLYQSAKLY